MFMNRPTVLKAWLTMFDFHFEVLRTVPLWVRFPNLPLNYWSARSLSWIGSLVGVPLGADKCTSRQLRKSFARLLIVVDTTKELPNSVTCRMGLGR
ncbi:PH and SEC7 domain-containing protein C11E3.11c [Bienertia sinuspersici]